MSPSPPDALPVLISAGGERCFALLHPAAAPAAGVAVVLVPPFGWEDMVSYRGRRDWAASLAAHGIAALRIDLPGTGDSAGGPRDPQRVAAWTEAVAEAARWLREHTGCERVAAIGIGLGGFVACHAAATGAPLDDLVLWGVPARGRTLLRELRAFARLEASRLAAQGAPERDPEPEGVTAAAGYVVTAETADALAAIDLQALAPFPAPAPRALLLDRDGVPVDERLRQGLAAAGAEVAAAPGSGYGEMVSGDMRSVRPPLELFASVEAWLRQPAARAAGPAPEPPAPAELELSVEGAAVREAPFDVERPDGALRGVLARPAGAERPLCLVLLNAGPQRRVGPNRMWVEIARRWAARGVPSLRLDVSGVGDSEGPTAGWDDEPAFYDGRHLAQVGLALDALQARGVPGPFVAIGLCSGANWAFHAGVRDPRVRVALVLNPRALFWDPLISTARGSRELGRLLDRRLWRRIVGGEVSRRAAVTSAQAIARWIAALPSLARRRLAARRAGGGQDPLEQALDRLERAGHRLTLVFTDREPLRDELEASGALARLERRPGVSLHTVASGAETHTLQPLWVQAAVHELVDRAVEGELAQPR